MSKQTRKARDAELHRASRSKVASRRPQCPNCQQRMPAPDCARDEWLLPHGHRRPDGEPCPGFRTAPTIAPPPPLPMRAAPVAVRPSTMLTVTEWMGLFDAMRTQAAKRPRIKRAERAAKPPWPSGQLALFTADGMTWAEMRDVEPASDITERHAELRHVDHPPQHEAARLRA